jgi:hypothetical protein
MRTVIGILLVVAVAAGLAGIGTHIYNLGVAQGIAQAGKLPSPGAGPYPVYPYPFYPYGGPFHGFGFGFFGLLWMVLLIFLLFAVARRAFWGGRHRGGWQGRGAPSWFEEWHRQAHEPKGTGGTV